MPDVTLQAVHKHYGKVKAVNGISLDCKDGEFLVILGPSGAGKTSTLKMIAGLEPITAGDIFVGGQRINAVPPERRNVAMVFESYALYPHLTVGENIAFPLRSKRFSLNRDEIRRRVEHTADLLRIRPLLDRKPGELSGGQKQRVSLGRALVKQAPVTLMDEPLSHLDAQLRHHMRRELKKTQLAFETTVIYVTHDYLEGLALAHRIVVLNEGRIHQIGAPDTVYHRPADTFVASLIGQPRVNLIPCQVRAGTEDAPQLVSEDGAFHVSCPGAARHAIAGDGAVTVGIRPQYLRLSESRNDGGMAGEVYVSERLGVKCMVEVKVGPHLLRALTERLDYVIGQPLRVCVPEERVMLFDAQSGKNLLDNCEWPA